MNMILSHTEKTKRQDAAFREAIYKMDQDTALAAAIRLGYDIDRLAEVVGMHRPDGSSRKMDAGESALLARALIYMKAKSVDVQYAPTRFREVFANNLNTEVPLGADKVSTPQFDQLGAFAPISNGVNDLPNIDVSQSETLNKVFPYGAQISYTVFDLARAAFSGVPLDTKKQEAARKAWERQLDAIAAVGDSVTGIKGITNHGSIQTVTTDSAGLWSAKTGLQIHADVAKLYTSIVSTTKGTVAPAVLALDTAHFALVSVKSWSADNSANITVLDFITKSLPGVRVVQWARLDLADAGGDGPRIVMFGDASDVCEFIINDMTMLAPQISGLGVNVPMYGRTAGVVASQPKGIAIMDDV
jgi:hypothetical protein